MSRLTDTASQNQFWQQFVSDGLHRKNITADDLADAAAPYPDLLGLDYSAATAQLKQYLSATGWKRLSERFRQYKSRRIGKKTTLTLREETLAKLRAMGHLAGLDDYDMVLEYLLDPEEDLEPHKQPLGHFDSSLGPEQATQVMLAKLQLRPATRKTVLNALQQAFEQGWLKGKSHPGKRTPAALDAATTAYMDQVKGLDSADKALI
jgi:hypothetical protein